MPGSGSERGAVSVLWAAGEARALAERLVCQEAARPGAPVVRLHHLCPACGSSVHGRPFLSGTGSDRLPWISLSRAAGVTVVAVSRAGPVGVDVEPEGAADFEGFDDVAVHPAERAVLGRTRLWVRKESLLKATGDGMTVNPSRIRLTGSDEKPVVLAWEGRELPRAWMYDVQVAPGFVAAVTVLADAGPALVVREVREARSAATTR